MPDLTRTEAVRLLSGLRDRRDRAINDGDVDQISRLDDQIERLTAEAPEIADVPRRESERLRAATAPPSPKRQGSGGNVLAALASLLFPGLGQLLQGRLGDAFFHFLIACILWFLLMGWVVHLASAIGAAKWEPK
ncbi:MAG: hypothetical protein AAF845_05655 [Bacteroidota bacterium]